MCQMLKLLHPEVLAWKLQISVPTPRGASYRQAVLKSGVFHWCGIERRLGHAKLAHQGAYLRGVPRLVAQLHAAVRRELLLSRLLSDLQIACGQILNRVLLHCGKAATACDRVSLMQVPHMLPPGH